MNAISTGLVLCRDAATWGVRLYLRHLFLVLGLAVIPTIQRFVLVYWGSQLPTAVNIATEIVTWAARLGLVAVVVRLGIAAEPRLRGVDWDARLTRVAEYIRSHPVSYLVQLCVLAAAFGVFGELLPLTVDAVVADDLKRQSDAVLIAVKNPLVITFTFIWLVGTFRLMMLAGVPAEPADARTPR